MSEEEIQGWMRYSRATAYKLAKDYSLDVQQCESDAMIALARCLKNQNNIANFQAFLSTTIQREVINTLRRFLTAERNLPSVTVETWDMPHVNQSLDYASAEITFDAMDYLDNKEIEYLKLRFIYCMNLTNTAAEMNLTLDEVTLFGNRTLKRLRRKFSLNVQKTLDS